MESQKKEMGSWNIKGDGKLVCSTLQFQRGKIVVIVSSIVSLYICWNKAILKKLKRQVKTSYKVCKKVVFNKLDREVNKTGWCQLYGMLKAQMINIADLAIPVGGAK
jgi:hypothetical protein